MERIDIYDKDGSPTGIVKDRSEPLAEGEYILAVGMWMADRENRILLTQRSMEKRWAPGKWENTAGHVQAGETCVQAILRELEDDCWTYAPRRGARALPPPSRWRAAERWSPATSTPTRRS